MRSRKEIEVDGTRKDILTLEVLLDIRDLLLPINGRIKERKIGKPRGRPKKIK